ncbi:MAG: prolipoprotein diacylglyceryl transferase family protein [Planctomycetia bacterium]
MSFLCDGVPGVMCYVPGQGDFRADIWTQLARAAGLTEFNKMTLPEWAPQLYPLMMILALSTGVWLKSRQDPDERLEPLERFWIGMSAFVGAMLAARLPFVVFGIYEGQDFYGLFLSGKTILAGLAGGYLAVELTKKLLGVTVRTGDSFVVPVAGSIAVGRLSCFVGGCCYGVPASQPWAVIFPNVDTVPRHPAQLYEFLFHSLAAVVLHVLTKRGLFRTKLFRMYLIAYCVYRFSSEYLRPEARLVWGLTAYQWSAALLSIVFAYLLFRNPARDAGLGVRG